MNKVKRVAESLLTSWSLALYKAIEEDGNFNCSACSIKHGRSIDAIYPFLYLYKTTGDIKWKKSALGLFYWTEKNVSLENGSFKNDLDSSWTGITVFTAITILDTLNEFAPFFTQEEKNILEERVKKALDFLKDYDDLKTRNINYPINNSLALFLGYKYFKNEEYKVKSDEFISSYINAITKNNLLYGEGRPHDKASEKNVFPVDIGYNAEESIPAIIRLSLERNDEKLYKFGLKLSYGLLPFILSDGGLDNSFGTRSFKWTYYGSRTSDGLSAAFLILSKENPIFGEFALKNLEAQEKATYMGLLSGGPGYKEAKVKPCSHHSITHLKVITYILSHELYKNYREEEITFPRYSFSTPFYFEEIGVILFSSKGLSLSLVLNDWIYLKEGHPSGGSVGLLQHEKAGVICASSMNEYTLKEKNNMQEVPRSIPHENLTFRLENGSYSSVYDTKASYVTENNVVKINGNLRNKEGEKDKEYCFLYSLENGKFTSEIKCEKGKIILPLVIYQNDEITISESKIVIKRDKYLIKIKSKNFEFPYKKELIFNLIPGFSALKTEIKIKEEIIKIEIEVIENEQNQEKI